MVLENKKYRLPVLPLSFGIIFTAVSAIAISLSHGLKNDRQN